MKPFHFIPVLCVFAALTLAVKAEDAAPASAPREDLGYDIYQGKTNKIDRVVEADPRFVWVLYVNDAGTRRIPRNELPPLLQAKYPYDQQKANAYVQTKVGENQNAVNSQRLMLQESEADLTRQLDALKKQQADQQAEINTLDKEIKTSPKKSRIAANDRTKKISDLKTEDDLRIRSEALEAKLKTVHAQMDALP